MVFLGSTWAISHSSSSTRALQAGAPGEEVEGGGKNQPRDFHSFWSRLRVSRPPDALHSPPSSCGSSLCLYLHSAGPGPSEPRQRPAGPPQAGPAVPSLSSLTQWGRFTWVWVEHRVNVRSPSVPHHPSSQGLQWPPCGLSFPGNGRDTQGAPRGGAGGPGLPRAVGLGSAAGTVRTGGRVSASASCAGLTALRPKAGG